MFFPQKITAIGENDRVLEIGPGSSPHFRSDVLLEYEFTSEEEARAQRSHTPPIVTDKPIVFYQGNHFPFKDKEFDYVICSHVIEHVSNVDIFISELTRVAKAGYLEYPTIYYDYVYNIPEHLSFIKWKNSNLLWMSKSDSPLSHFQAVHKLLNKSLEKGYFGLPQELEEYMFEGFEWFGSFTSVKTDNIEDLTFDTVDIPGNYEKLCDKADESKNESLCQHSLLLRVKRKIMDKLF